MLAGAALVALQVLGCGGNGPGGDEQTRQSRQATTTTTEPCFGTSSECTLTRTVNDDGTELVRIDKPAVIRRDTTYDKIVFQPGDVLTFSADGCAQTGGAGDTWKRYVRPLGDESDHLYFATVSIPGVFADIALRDLFPAGSLSSPPVAIPATSAPVVLHLGYTDDDYGDNGYWGHDDGNYDQCKITSTNDGGPAHVQISIVHGTPTTPANGDWDLVANLRPGEPLVFDSNLIDLNPRWGWQAPFRLAPDYDPSQTDQITDHDECWVCSGHDNWRDVTATGPLFWDGHDTGFGDDDYNIKIQTQDVPDTLYVAGVTRGNGGVGNHPVRMIKGEFDSDETVDWGEFDAIPWWKSFHDAVDQGDGIGDDGGAAARSKIDGHFAIMTGLMGLDTAHPPPASELHPVHAIAIRINDHVVPNDDSWAFFVRNFGDEGYCSSKQHFINFQNNQYTFRLPRPTPDEGVDASAVATQGQTVVRSVSAPASATISTNPDQDTFLTVTLGNPPLQSVVVGEIHLVWPSNGRSSATWSSQVNASAIQPAAEEDGGDPEDQVRAAFKSLSTDQQVLARARLAKIQPPQPPHPSFDVPVVVTSAPPPVVTAPPSVETAPATRKLERTILKTTTLCSMVGGGLVINGQEVCQTLAPTTIVDTRTGLPDDPNCLPDLVTVHLTTLDPSGTGTVTEFGYDGQQWTSYAGPFIARPGATSLFVRSHDNAGHSEAPHSVSLPSSTLSVRSSQLALLANGNLFVDDAVSVLLPSGVAASIGNAGSGQTNLGVAARVGNIWSVAPVFLRDRSRVEGTVRTSAAVNRQNQVVVTGSVIERTAMSLPNLGACTTEFGTGLSDVSLEPDQTRSLEPGSYGRLSVKSRARLTLAAGTYRFQSVVLEPDAVVQVPTGGAVVLFVESELTHRGSFRDATGALAPVLIAYFGTQAAPIEGAFRGALVAPKARVDLYTRADGFRGVFFAHDLEVHPNMTVRQEQTAFIR